MAEIEPSEENDYQAGGTATFSREVWNVVMASIAARLKARELLEATFETLIEDGTQAALDMISVNVAPQLGALIDQVNALEEQLEDIIGGGTAPNSLQLDGRSASYYLALTNATGLLPVSRVSGVASLIASALAPAIANLKGAPPETLDTVEKLAAAVGNDPGFAANVITALAGKVDKLGTDVLSAARLRVSAADLYDASADADRKTARWYTEDGYSRFQIMNDAYTDALSVPIGVSHETGRVDFGLRPNFNGHAPWDNLNLADPVTVANFPVYFGLRKVGYGQIGPTGDSQWVNGAAAPAGTFMTSILIQFSLSYYYAYFATLQWLWNGTYYTMQN
ncbi:MAG: hypothetical protein DI527_00770 [Chelatococcus sp.]|nr:MAG: hypothetical protein DI527_00770 [Chelatococcus sp.]